MEKFVVLEQLKPLYDSLDDERFEIILKNSEPYIKMISEYECALLEVETKLKVLNNEFLLKDDGKIEAIKSRIKSTQSLIKKIRKKGIEFTKERIQNTITDIAGIRVICPFVDDVYSLVNSLKKHFDLKVLEEKDYIKKPKPNGYRSYHLIVSIPVFLYEKVIYRTVEMQFRTLAMDLWSTLEHKMRYKKDIINTYEIQKSLENCVQICVDFDEKMKSINELIKKQIKE